MESSNILYTFPPLLRLYLDDEADSIEAKCANWSDEYHPSKKEIQKALIERMIVNYNLNASSPLKLVNLSFDEIAWSLNPKDSTQWDWNRWNEKLYTQLDNRKEHIKGRTEFEDALYKITNIIYPEINWSEQFDTLKDLQKKDGISPHQICEEQSFIDITRIYSQTLTPITNLVKSMISNGFLTQQAIEAIYSCVIEQE